ncbi:DUF4333 domain-containing protein [Gordonia sp. HY442]|uniref:DUF4333 domain-containing protein n=1 Tax=Gordonia zhenghanii TaxID=2911516 RepID=UPI001F357BD1|nr:DUF4333 domain-containing protein [Gordonia zhenghanii]MCF8605440.1 DUF4333 domain-containing protein [Gordonia zhenghanii]
MRTLRTATVVATLAALPVLAACSASIGGTTLDHDKLNDEITTKLDTEYAKFPRTVSSVDCDDPGKDPKVGTKFQCVADVDGTDVRVDVTTTTEDMDVKYQTVDTLYDMAYASKTLAPSVSQRLGFQVNVNCGNGLKALTPGSTFECRVSNDSGESDTLTYFVTEGGGKDRWEIN